MTAVSIDGVIVAPGEARISVFDRGLLYGDGCFEVLRTWDGVARDLEAHVERLFESARFLMLKTMERGKLVEAVYKTIAAAAETGVVAGGGTGGDGAEQRIRIVVTRGEGSLDKRLAELGPGRAIVIVEPLPEQPTEIALSVVDWPMARREQRGHKTLAYLDHVIARELARAAGADEGIRLDDEGSVVECATSNVFVVVGGTVSTPSVEHGGLPGIVRERVLAECAKEGIPSRVREMSMRDLRSADELFVTSSLRGVVPVTRLDGVPLAAGPITKQLAAAYVAAMRTAT